MSIFLNVDPLAEKYVSFTPYAYVGNRPLIAVDPDGREIVITSGKESYTYDPNKEYKGNNSFIQKNIAALNLANTVDIGKSVIEETVSTKLVMRIIEGKTTNEGTHEFDLTTMTMTARESNYFGGTSDAESVMHEVFHFSQKINGEADRSISTELEAYVFQYSLGLKLGGTSLNTNATDKGLKLETVFNKLVFDKTDNLEFSRIFREGVNLFKEGYSRGDIYSKFPLNEQKTPNRLKDLNKKGVFKY